MGAHEVVPITWEYYRSMEFLRQVSEPLRTYSSADGPEMPMDEEGSTSGPKYNPRTEKERRDISAKEKREWNKTKGEERQSQLHEVRMSTLSNVNNLVAKLQKKKDEREKKRKLDQDAEVSPFYKYLADRTQQVLYNIFQT